MSLKWADCDPPAPEERSPEQIRKDPPFASLVPSMGFLMNHPPPLVTSFQYSMTKEVIWPLMELMGSTSPSSYSAVIELDRKFRELSAAIDIHEDEQFNASTLEWSCVLGANVRQAGEFSPPMAPSQNG